MKITSYLLIIMIRDGVDEADLPDTVWFSPNLIGQFPTALHWSLSGLYAFDPLWHNCMLLKIRRFCINYLVEPIGLNALWKFRPTGL